MSKSFDVVVIGAGPGGYVAAVRAAQLGFKTACVEKESTLGGTCLNVGCIPSKALLESSEHYYWLRTHAKEHGIATEKVGLDFSQLMQRKEKVVKSLTDGVEALLKKNQVERIAGTASFVSSNEIRVNDEIIRSQYFILATGSEPIALPFLPFDETKVVSSTGALSLKSIPKKMIVVGGGVIGVELASVYCRLGAQVAVVEMLEQICVSLEPTMSRALQQSLKKQGIEFYLPAKVIKADKNDQGVMLTIETNEGQKQLEADVVLVCIGRKPYSKGLDLDKAGVAINSRGQVEVDGLFRSVSQPNIFAIGDIIDGPMLAHKASEEGYAVAEILAGHVQKVNYLAIPNVVYTNPEAASVGFTEQEAKEAGLETFTGQSFFRGNARARCQGESDGFVKVVGDKSSGCLIGLHILGPHASEMIGEGVVAIQNRMTVRALAHACHAHPTLSEVIKEACLTSVGATLHG